jgi:8-oxo-dGTP diphosphatase
VTLVLLRHVDAGDRGAWEGDDRRRPASARGHRQAEALVDTLSHVPLDRVVTSPYRRCVESVAALATARDLEVEEEDLLAEGTPPDLVARLVRGLTDQDVLLCSHGDVIGGIVDDLRRRELVGDDARWPKGSAWILDGDPARPSVTYLPPP